MKFYVIAELCGNHMGNMEYAEDMIEEAKLRGADAVKLQYYRVDDLFKSTDPLYEPVKKAQLTISQIQHLREWADERKIDFICTAFKDPALIDDLESAGVKNLKIREADSGNRELLDEALLAFETVFVSTTKIPLEMGIMFHPRIVWMMATPRYPYLDKDFNLAATTGFRGLSDHTKGITTAIATASVAKASGRDWYAVEKHVTLSHAMQTVDEPVSIDFTELETLTKHLRRIENYTCK